MAQIKPSGRQGIFFGPQGMALSGAEVRKRSQLRAA
jgi:hypothetical protein